MKAKYGYLGMTADFIHIGHIRAMKQCLEKCDKLMIGLMTDDCVKHYKGKAPLMNYDQRHEVLENIGLVYKIVPQPSFQFPHHVLRLRQSYGEDFIIFDSPEHKRKGHDVLIDRMDGISSTKFKERYLL